MRNRGSTMAYVVKAADRYIVKVQSPFGIWHELAGYHRSVETAMSYAQGLGYCMTLDGDKPPNDPS